jgi:hypothetical protein
MEGAHVFRSPLSIAKVNGWPSEVISASALPFSEDTCKPKAITEAGIEEFKQAWVAAVGRALKAGVDVSSRITNLKIYSAEYFTDHRDPRSSWLSSP